MRTNDGIILMGSSPEELVEDLMRQSFDAPKSAVVFMRQAADRALLHTGKRVSTASASAFIHDLLAAGLLVEE